MHPEKNPPRAPAFWHNVWQVAKTLQARLRFIALLAAVGLVIGSWDYLKAVYERLTRPGAVASAAGSDTEYWCPMHPTVVRDQPDKCPICNMPLSKRKKSAPSDEDAWPAGVVSRVQLTPYRVALAGVRTVPVEYQPLQKEIHAVGFVEFDERRLARIAVRVTGKSRIDKLIANVTGQRVSKGDALALIYSPDLVVTVQNLVDARASNNAELLRLARERLRLWGIEEDQIKEVLHTSAGGTTHLVIRSPQSGHVIRKYQVEGEYVEEGMPLYDVADLATVWIEAQVYEHEAAFLREGLPVTATTQMYPGRVFRGVVSFVHPHLDAATRTLRVRFNVDNPGHELRPGMFADVRLRVPVTELPAFAGQGGEGALLDAVVGPLGAAIRQAGEEVRRQQGLVLSVPERAVIDTGHRKLVYREALPNEFEGVEVTLGPRAGAFYPVVSGLRAGDRIVTAGSFLIDAETRLTAGAASTYFGASGTESSSRSGGAITARPSLSEDTNAKIAAVRAKLSAVDRRLVEEQEFCANLTGSRLGSMGMPIKLVLEGQPVFLCCKGCVDQAKADPKKTLRTVEELKARQGAPHHHGPAAEIEKNLNELGPADGVLARAQKFCAVQKDSPLGSMGKPVKVMVGGMPIFVCCEGCVEAAQKLKK